MADDLLTREQRAVLEFKRGTQPLGDLLREGGRGETDPAHELVPFFTAFNNAVEQFGLAEMSDRQGSRYRAIESLDQDSATVDALNRRDRLNERGLSLLDDAVDALGVFQEVVNADSAPDAGDDIAAELDVFAATVREQLAQVEIKPSDVEQINERLEAALDVAHEDGIEGLGAYLEEQVSELRELRQRSDRGTEGNIPIWKAAAIAAYIGVALVAAFSCNRWGKCVPTSVGVFTTTAVAVLVAIFC